MNANVDSSNGTHGSLWGKQTMGTAVVGDDLAAAPNISNSINLNSRNTRYNNIRR
jgi:hypothetical protein